MKPMNSQASERTVGAGLALRLFQSDLPASVCAVIEEEMELAGFTRGLLCIGPSPIFPQSVFILWLPSDEASFTETIFRGALDSPEAARLVFRALASKWRTAQAAFSNSRLSQPGN